ncbi:MAG TPA: hypothetical protein VJU14_04960 [Solirubrobacterales bacterium]|nr:hypothetical protein [Solirubrobacterales bacterium]
MEIADRTAHLALSYIAAAKAQGYAMTVIELEAYMQQPRRRPGIPAIPERTVTTTNVDRAIQQYGQRAIEAIGKALTESLQPVQRRVPGKPGVPAEPISEWLGRLGWLASDSGRVHITELGEAMLAHLEQETLEEEVPVGVVLDQGDQLASARVMQQIAEVGPCSVVDPYFSMDSLLNVLQLTEVHSVLTGTGDQGKLAGLAVAMRSVSSERPFEVRKSSAFHDRLVIPDEGPLWLLGTSLTGFGKKLSLMVRLDDEQMGQALRHLFEQTWRSAEPVMPQLEDGESNDAST